jgi:serine/threonine-protein kinase
MAQTLAHLRSALAGRYEFERELGRGGMATVYLAHDLRHDRRVAVKVLHEELTAVLGAERFLAEIRTTAALQHPNILPLFDSGEAAPIAGDPASVRRLYYVMPYVAGETLRARLTREVQLPVDDAVRIATQAAAALDYAHRHGVIHRDIKPENLLLQDGQVQVADFGIALAVSRAGGERMTQTGLSLGTPQYMAPEQATGEKIVDARADVYALGVVLFEMLVGEPPFTGPTVQSVVARLLTEQPRAVSSVRRSVPPYVDAAVGRALEKLPADRFATASAFATALHREYGDTPRHAERRSPPGLASAARGISRVLPWGAAVLALVGGFVAGRRSAPSAARHVERFSVAIPAVLRLVPSQAGQNRPAVAIAPDASLLVIVATPVGGGKTQLFLRPLDRVVMTPIPGTEGGDYPFFSPDGDWIGFQQDGKLKKVPTAGGPVVTIGDVPTSISGAAWGPNGVIIYGLTFGALMRTSTEGTDTRVVATPDTVAAESFYHPQLLPDGKTVLVTASVPQGTARIVLVSLATGDTTTVLHGMSSAGYLRGAKGDRLVYVRPDGALMSVRFDLTAKRAVGAPTLLAEEVDVIAGGSIANLAMADDGTFAYARSYVPQRELLVREGDSVRALDVGHRFFRGPRYSRDGRRILVGTVAGANDVLGDIWSYDLDRATLSRVTFDGSSTFPSFSPDGQWVTYASLVHPRDRDLLRVRTGGGTPPETLLTAPGQQHEAEVTPDGRTLVFREIRPRTGRDIWATSLTVPAPERFKARRPLAVTPYDERSLAISPNGRWLAYVSDASGRPEVYVRPIADAPDRWQLSPTGGDEPRWDHSGRAIYYRHADTLFRVDVADTPTFTPGARRMLFSGSFVTDLRANYDVSPDGRRFVLLRELDRDRTDELRVVLHAFDAGKE